MVAPELADEEDGLPIAKIIATVLALAAAIFLILGLKALLGDAEPSAVGPNEAPVISNVMPLLFWFGAAIIAFALAALSWPREPVRFD